MVGVFGEGLFDHAVELPWNVRLGGRRMWRRSVEVCGDQQRHVCTGKRRPPGQTFVQHTGQRIYIGARILLAGSTKAFGRHVEKSADRVAGWSTDFVEGTGDPETEGMRVVLV